MPEEVSCSKIRNVYVISPNTGRYDWVTLVIVCEMELFLSYFLPALSHFHILSNFPMSQVTVYEGKKTSKIFKNERELFKNII